MKYRGALFTAGFALVAMALGSAYAPSLETSLSSPMAGPAQLSDEKKVQTLLEALPQPAALDEAQKSAGCQVNGVYPDHACTPGAVFATSSVADICTPGHAQSVRSVSTSLKKKIYAAYGIAYPQPTGTYELDHLVPLELGGSNAAANLFPEVEPQDGGSQDPGFKEKDVVEDYLHDEVCAGALPLTAAQVQIADDWLAVYNSLSPATISAIKQKYQSWAD
jgi:hypothetical protein